MRNFGQNTPNQQDRDPVPYTIQIQFDDVGEGDTETTTPSRDVGPRAFIWTGLSVVTRAASNGEDSGDFDLLIIDEGASQRFMKEGRQHADGLVDQTNRTRTFPVPWKFEDFSAITVECHNNHATLDGTLIVTLYGYLE